MSDLSAGLKSLLDAAPDYLEAHRYYSGTTTEAFSAPNLQRKLAQVRASGMRINFSATAVDAVVDRLEVSAVSTISGDPDAEAALASLYEENQLDLEFPDLFRNAAKYGDAFVLLEPPVDQGETVELFYNSPLIMRVIYSEENTRKPAFAIKRWQSCGADPQIRVNLYYSDRVERYTTAQKDAKGVKETEFYPYVSDDPEDNEPVIYHDLGFFPVYHLRNARPYGVPEHLKTFGPQDAINKLAITHLASVDYLGFPQRYVMGASGTDASEADDFDADIFHDTAAPQGNGLSPDTTGTPDGLTSDPGGLWWLNNVKGVGQFEAAEAKNFLDPIDTYIKLMSELTNTPLYVYQIGGQLPSAEGQRRAEAPLLRKIRNRQMQWGAVLQDFLTDALMVLGFPGTKVQVFWSSPSVLDGKETWESALLQIQSGVPVRQVLLEIGYAAPLLDSWGIPEATYVPPTAPPTAPTPLPESDAA